MEIKFEKKKATKKAKALSALEAIDAQIVVAQKDAEAVLEKYGSDSKEYGLCIGNLTRLAEQRANVANSEQQRKKVDPNVWIAGGFTLVSSVATPLLLMVYDEEHVVPKFIKGCASNIKDFLRKD